MYSVYVELTNINNYMNKYEKWYASITKNAKNRLLSVYTEQHHIVPCSLGGLDDKQNLVDLTAREHFICHWLLTKIYPTGEEHWKMLNALRMMRAKNSNQQRYNTKITGRVYARLKEEYSILQSERVSGENNPMFGNKFYRSEDGKKRQRESIFGGNNGAKQESARQKISESKLGKSRGEFTDQWKENLSKNHKSKQPGFNGSLSENTKKLIGDKTRGRKQSDEEKLIRSLANMGKKREKKLCPHCNQYIAVNGYARFHGNRCRSRLPA